MTLGWAIIVKGRWKLQVRITWMALHLTQMIVELRRAESGFAVLEP